MNRDQKAAAIAEIATQIDESDAIFAVDYRGISVEQVAELRTRLRDADATFKVVKNSLTERAADQAGATSLKDYLAGPTALTFVRGDVAVAAKAIADYARATQMLPFKGGMMGEDTLDIEQIRSLSRLPAREVLYGQLVGIVASPVSGLVRTLGALVGGLAVALGQVRDKKESGEIPAGEPPAAEGQATHADTSAAETPAEEAAAQETPEAESEAKAETDAPAEAEAETEESAPAEAEAEAEAPADTDAPAEAQAEATETEESSPPAADDDATQAEAEASEDATAASEDAADTNPTKED
jgi:large subunit ribosomal protein L10